MIRQITTLVRLLGIALSIGAGSLMVASCGSSSNRPANPPDPSLDESQASDAEAGAVAEGEKAIASGNYMQARKDFSQILSRHPNHPKANHYMGVVLEKLNDTRNAESYYRKAISIAPDLVDSVMNLSALLIDAGEYEEAEAILVESSKKNPKDPLLLVNLAYARLGTKNFKGAREAFAAALAISDTPEVRLGLADVEIRNGTHQEALPHIRRAKELAASDVGILAECAELYRLAHSPSLCIETLNQAISIKPDTQLYANRALCKQMNKNLPEAKADYQKAINADPNYAPAYFMYGRFLLEVEHNKTEAINAFETCARIAPRSDCQRHADAARK